MRERPFYCYSSSSQLAFLNFFEVTTWGTVSCRILTATCCNFVNSETLPQRRHIYKCSQCHAEFKESKPSHLQWDYFITHIYKARLWRHFWALGQLNLYLFTEKVVAINKKTEEITPQLPILKYFKSHHNHILY